MLVCRSMVSDVSIGNSRKRTAALVLLWLGIGSIVVIEAGLVLEIFRLLMWVRAGAHTVEPTLFRYMLVECAVIAGYAVLVLFGYRAFKKGWFAISMAVSAICLVLFLLSDVQPNQYEVGRNYCRGITIPLSSPKAIGEPKTGPTATLLVQSICIGTLPMRF